FGALDYITRFKLRADLVRIWQTERKTILFVTHDIDEAVQLADRVVVMSRRPATIRTVVTIPTPRPRDLESSDYLLARDRVFTAMGMNPHSGGEIIEEAVDHTVSLGRVGILPEEVNGTESRIFRQSHKRHNGDLAR